MSMEEAYDRLRGALQDAGSIVISGHENADGDAVGAVGALRRHLEMADKKVTALLLEPLSSRYGFMEFARHYEVYDPAQHDALLREADVFIMCDLSSFSRLGRLRKAVEDSGITTICVDHHPCENGGPADVNVLDDTATATGRIAWDYIQHVDGKVDREIAESVFVSICTDTGWFRYQNTTSSVLDLAAELTRFKLDMPAIYRSIYQSQSTGMLRLLGHATRMMREECNGRFVWSLVRDEFVKDLDVERFDSDPIIDVLRSGREVEAVALFSEQEDGRVNVSLRSRGVPDMNMVARQFGGGGHSHAAGTTLSAKTAEHDMHSLVAVVRRALSAD